MSNNRLENCPNFDKSFKGYFNQNFLIEKSKIDYINKFTDLGKEAYCDSCSEDILKSIYKKNNELNNQIELEFRDLKKYVGGVMILTSQSPIQWEYDVIDIISCQKSVGTGFVTELSRSFNDLFGKGSKRSDLKLKIAIDECQDELRLEAAIKGANAIIAASINFNEISSGSANLLMVHICGTAIKVDDKFLPKDRIDILHRLQEKMEIITKIKKLL